LQVIGTVVDSGLGLKTACNCSGFRRNESTLPAVANLFAGENSLTSPLERICICLELKERLVNYGFKWIIVRPANRLLLREVFQSWRTLIERLFKNRNSNQTLHGTMPINGEDHAVMAMQ